MSGHSKWSTIKRKKGAIDAARGNVFQKISKEIHVACKNGDGDPSTNSSLRMVIEKAKAANMPKTNIDSAIAKATNKNNAESYDEIRYEGYAPSGVAIMIDCLTDNKNRTASFVRSTLSKRGGNLGTDGSVSYMFLRKGIIILDKSYDEDELMEYVLELDILDFISNEDGCEIYTTPDNFISVKDELSKKYDKFIMSEVTFVASNLIELSDDATEKVMNLIEALEELDDVQNVYHNLDV